MSLPAVELLGHFYEIGTSPTINSGFKWPDGTPVAAERPPAYNPTGQAADPAGAVWVDGAYTGGGSDGTVSKPFTTWKAGLNKIRTGGVDRALIARGAHAAEPANSTGAFDGRYRTDWGAAGTDHDLNSAGGHVTVIAAARADGACVMSGFDTLPSASFTGAGPYVYGVSYNPPCSDCIQVDGVIQRKVASAPGAGEYSVSGTTLTLGTNPAGKTVEASYRFACVGYGEGIKTTGLEIRGVSFHGYATDRVPHVVSGVTKYDTIGAVNLSGTQQKLTRVVVANSTGYGLSTRTPTHYTLTEFVLTGCGNISGKSWDTYKDSYRTSSGVRIWGNNILHTANVCPGDSASLAGIKAIRMEHCTDDGVLVGYCFSNGWWLDIQCVDNQLTNFVVVHNGGYGITGEVGHTQRFANGLVAYNGSLHNIADYCGAGKRAGNQDGYRISGYNSVSVYHVTAAANYGSNYWNAEDGRYYPTNAHVGLGDTWNTIRRNNVYVRTVEHDAGGNLIGQGINFHSSNGAVVPYNCTENASNGQHGTFCINHAEMHSSAPPGSTPVNAGTDHNVYYDATGSRNLSVAAPTGTWAWTPCSPTPCTTCKLTGCGGATTLTGIAAAQALMAAGEGFEAGSIDVQRAAGSKHTSDLFPRAGDTVPEWSWWGLAAIPNDGAVLTAGQTVPTWVRTALGVGAADTLYPGCGLGLPYPRPIGATTGNAAPTVTNLVPSDGSSLTTGVGVPVTVDASDDGGFAGLTCAAQTYSPAKAITSVTVAGTVATVVATAHGASNGGQVRIQGCTPAALNGTFTVTSSTDANHLTYTVPAGTATATAVGTVEPLGTTIAMAVNGASTGFVGTWSPGAAAGSVRRLEVTVTDSGTPAKSTVVVATVNITAAGNHPPTATVLDPQPSKTINPTTGQTIAAYIFDQDGDALSAPAYTVKDSIGTAVRTGALTVQASAVSTTIATAIADVATLTGTQSVALVSAAGATSTGGVLVAIHSNVPVTIQYGGVSGTSLTNCKLLAGSGALSVGDAVKSANYAATFDATGFAGNYTALVQATDAAHSSTGVSPAILFTTNSAPTVAWSYPTPSPKITVRGTITLQVSASDDAGLATCHGGLYKVDGAPVYLGPLTGTSTGFTYSLDTTTLTDLADHALRARVVDAAGLVTVADVTFHVDQSVDTTGPTISSVIPAAGATVRGTVTVGAQLADTSGVASATYSIDGGRLTGSLTVGGFGWVAGIDSTDPANGLGNGPHTLVIAATDMNGNTSDTSAAPVTFTVANTSAAPWLANHNAVGFVVPVQPAALAAADRTALWASLTAAGATTVRTVADWSALQPANTGAVTAGLNDTLDPAALAALDAFLDDAAAAGIRVIVTVYRCPTWAHPTTTVLPGGVTWGTLAQVAPEREPANLYPDLANFAWLLADRYGAGGAHDTAGTLVALELWDEPNTEQWMQPTGTGTRTVNYGPDAGRYAQAVQGFYAAVHSGTVTHRGTRTAHPEILCVVGATGPATDGGGPSGTQYAPGTFTAAWLAVAGSPAAFDHVSHHPSFDGVLYAGTS